MPFDFDDDVGHPQAGPRRRAVRHDFQHEQALLLRPGRRCDGRSGSISAGMPPMPSRCCWRSRISSSRASTLSAVADRDREADAAGKRHDGARDADDASVGVDERAAGVARVDGRVHLNQIGEAEARTRLKRASKRADDARGHGPVEAERVADGDDELADAQRPRVQLRDRQPEGADAQDGEVDRRVGVLDAGLEAAAVGEGDARQARVVGRRARSSARARRRRR